MTLSAVEGFTVGTFNHRELFATSFLWKALFLLSALLSFLRGHNTFLHCSWLPPRPSRPTVLVEEGRQEDDLPDQEYPDDEVFLKLVKEELEMTDK